MRIFNDFSEFKAAVGTELGTSEWIEITQERINLFAQATCDEQWIHINQERAKKELPGGTTIAHGLLSLSLAQLLQLLPRLPRLNLLLGRCPRLLRLVGETLW